MGTFAVSNRRRPFFGSSALTLRHKNGDGQRQALPFSYYFARYSWLQRPVTNGYTPLHRLLLQAVTIPRKSSGLLPPKRPPAPSLTYAQWRERAREKLAGPSAMRERRWTQLFISGKTPDEAAAEANIYYSNSRVRESTFAALDHPRLSGQREYCRARFSVAHELGHVALSHEGTHCRGATSDRARALPSRVRSSELEADEWHPLSHQAADEMHVTAEPIRLRHDNRAFGLSSGLNRRG